MKRLEVRRFMDEKVVGQTLNGLFFEGSVEERWGRPVVVEPGQTGCYIIDSSEIKWLTTAKRYC